MIKTFTDRRSFDLFNSGKSRGFPADVERRAARKLEYLNLATRLADLSAPRSNRLHALEGSRKGQYSISINHQWRICFRFENGNAYDVEVCDYH